MSLFAAFILMTMPGLPYVSTSGIFAGFSALPAGAISYMLFLGNGLGLVIKSA